MNLKLGFVGVGNMGSAMLKGIVESGLIHSEKIFAYDIDSKKLENLKESYKINVVANSSEVVENSDVIILAVKPNMMKGLLKELSKFIDDKKIIVSVAVGIPIKFYKKIIGDDKKIIRTMPNTPALVSEGMTLVSYDNNVTKEEVDDVKAIFACVGKVEEIDEKLISEVTALTSSSPAYVFMFIEAMADAAVLSGIPRNMAYRLASQAVLGSAKMVLETGKHPGELKDMVCSPAGTTIEAVRTLEMKGFRSSVIEAMGDCTKRAREIGIALEKEDN